MPVLSICIAGAAGEGCALATGAKAAASAHSERVAKATCRVDVMEVSFDSGAV
jgi:hypothetical protein